jgi:hypothetical protein
MTTADEYRWYVLYPKGRTVSDVIFAGPFTHKSMAEEALSMSGLYEFHLALLQKSKIDYHMEQDRKLVEWLKEHDVFNR